MLQSHRLCFNKQLLLDCFQIRCCVFLLQKQLMCICELFKKKFKILVLNFKSPNTSALLIIFLFMGPQWEARVTQYERDFDRIGMTVRKEVLRFEVCLCFYQSLGQSIFNRTFFLHWLTEKDPLMPK